MFTIFKKKKEVTKKSPKFDAEKALFELYGMDEEEMARCYEELSTNKEKQKELKLKLDKIIELYESDDSLSDKEKKELKLKINSTYEDLIKGEITEKEIKERKKDLRSQMSQKAEAMGEMYSKKIEAAAKVGAAIVAAIAAIVAVVAPIVNYNIQYDRDLDPGDERQMKQGRSPHSGSKMCPKPKTY